MTYLLVAFLLSTRETPDQQWSRVERLRSGARVTITYMDGQVEEGFFAGANATKLMVRLTSSVARPAEVVPRDGIREIEVDRRYKPSAGKAAVIGAFVALGLLTIERAPAGLKVLWMPIGALVGYTAAPVHTQRQVIYRA